jgi:MFS superfamily sulfate permease-like transporter/ActR/RegA family two-component response regulator
MLGRFFPFFVLLKSYDKQKFKSDLIGGITVAMVLIPQSMAYAQLAGLPSYYGLYAAFLPPMIAALFGSSYHLATGPVAVVSLMTNTALAPIATAGSDQFIAYAILLSLIVGGFQFLLGVLRMGLVVNFLSHPVVNGFTNAAALIIATSQLASLLGVSVDSAEHHYETIYRVFLAAQNYIHLPSLGMALLTFAIMILVKRLNPRLPSVLIAVVITTLISFAANFNRDYVSPISQIHSDEIVKHIQEFNKAVEEEKEKSVLRVDANKRIDETVKQYGLDSVEALKLKNEIALLNVEIEHLQERQHEIREKLRQAKFQAVETEKGKLDFYLEGQAASDKPIVGDVWRLKVGVKALKVNELTLIGGGAIIGSIPAELPKFQMPALELGIVLKLFPMAMIISILGFMEAISIAKSIAAKTGQRLDPNQELIGQGLANLLGSAFKAYPVSGSFSRSAVNLQAGAATSLSNVISSIIVGLTLLFFTKLLYHLPQSVLAAIIMMAVVGLINISGFIHAWKVQRYDGAISIITCLSTLAFAPHLDKGVMIGVALSIGLYLLRNTRPDIAVLSLHHDESYRHAKRHSLAECNYIAVIRFNGSLFFANVSYLETVLLEEISTRTKLKHIILACDGVNELDASGEEMLSVFVDRLREGKVDISFSGFNDHVMDVLRRTHLYEKIGEDHLFPNVAKALEVVHAASHNDSEEIDCPLKIFLPVRYHLEAKPNILLVDDNIEFNQLLSKRMEKRGISVISAVNGLEALAKMKQGRFDVILLDMSMPEMDGLEVFKNLKEIDNNVQVIFVTGAATLQNGVDAMKLGAFDLVQKPIDIEELEKRIKQAKINRMKIIEQYPERTIEELLRRSGW